MARFEELAAAVALQVVIEQVREETVQAKAARECGSFVVERNVGELDESVQNRAQAIVHQIPAPLVEHLLELAVARCIGGD